MFFKLYTKLILLCIVGICSANLISATEFVFDNPISENSFPEQLTQLSEQLSQFESIHTQFSQTKKISVLKYPLKTKGEFLFSKNHGVYWFTKVPFKAEIVITSEGYFQRKNGALVLATPSSVKTEIQSYLNAFLMVFSGNFKDLKDFFQLSYLAHDESWTIGLTPKGEIGKFIQNLQLVGDFPSSFRYFIILEVNGDTTKIEFHETKYSKTPLNETEQNLFR